MLHGGALFSGALEVRRARDGSVALAGSFPYGVPAVLSDGGRTGRPRKEIIESRAFSYRVDREEEDIFLLWGHDFDHALARKSNGSLSLRDTAAALLFNAKIPPEVAETSHGRDVIAMIKAGLAIGLSPGFRLPPERAVADAETIEEEPDDGSLDDRGQPRRGAIIRRIRAALLYELSIVSVPAYPETQVEMRRWSVHVPSGNMMHPLARWRL